MKKLATYLLFISLLLVVGVNETWSADASDAWTPSGEPTAGQVYSCTNNKMTITAYGSWQYVNSGLKKKDDATYPDATDYKASGDLKSYLDGKTYFKILANANGTIKVKGLYGNNATKIVCGLSNYQSDVFFHSDATDNTAWGAPCTIEFQVHSGRNYYVFVPSGGDVLFSGFEFYDATGIAVKLESADNGNSNMNIAYPFFVSSSTIYAGNTAQAVNGYDITLNATPNDGYLFWRWKIGNDENNKKYEYSNNTTITDYAQYATDGTLTITPEFVDGIHVYTKVEGCGIATFSHGGEQCENGYWTTPWTDFTFTATPEENYTFEGWYNGDTQVSTDNPYTAQGVHTDLTLTAKFTRATTDNTSYVNYHNRLSSQWNFDSCDGYRFNESKINTGYWTVYTDNYNNSNGNGTKTYTYNQAISGTTTDPTLATSYGELTYDGTSVVPVTAGLKFLAPAGNITIKVNYTNGSATGVNLIVNDNVKMLIPNVENTYSDDYGSDDQVKETNKDNYTNCVHHWKRDILYVSLEEGVVGGHIVNKRIDDSSKTLYNSGGSENTDNHYFDKMNYMGTNGVPCVLQFNGTTSFNRIGINRNLTYSFYPEYISDLGSSYTKPEPRMRIIGSPQGQKVANIGSTYTVYSNAIAMTFGGWKNTEGNSSYTAYKKSTVTDSWSVPNQSVDADNNAVNSIAVDGFSIFSQNTNLPRSESLMPIGSSGKYHPACQGIFNDDGNGNYKNAAKENYTLWTLPCRGSYLKFEPTIPGVLNVDIYQKGGGENNWKNGIRYHIADEFGNAVTRPNDGKETEDVDGYRVFYKNNSGIGMNKEWAGYQTQTDGYCYVKYSFNVFPGKTYYIFSPEAVIGLAGFYFEPYVYRTSFTDELARQDVKLAKDTIGGENGNTGYTYPSDLSGTDHLECAGSSGYDITYDHRAVEVTLNRSFKANIWNSICLPFSMNNLSMETVFGKGTKVVLLRDIQDAKKTTSGLTTANFIMHENQDIVAGYPYLIYPTQDVTSIKTNAYIATTSPSIPTINSVGFNTALGTGDYSGITDFDFTGTFSSETKIPAGSYYMNTKGNLTRASKEVQMKPYRAYLAAKTSNNAKTIGAIFLGNMIDEDEDTATGINNIGIEDVVTESVNIKADANIYNMQGQKIGDCTSDINSLPKGVYIINGKKYIVK